MNKTKYVALLCTFFLFVSSALSETVNYGKTNSSLIKWQDLEERRWLNYEEWKRHQLQKDRVPDWEKNLRDIQHSEKVGIVLDCEGKCLLYRGLGSNKTQYGSSILEGDELHTIEDSYAWIYLMDGTLVRMSPRGSMTFKEINIGRETTFIFARVNQGNIYWYSRSKSLVKETNERETDTLFVPISMYDANSSATENEYNEDDLSLLLKETDEHTKQYKRLNKLIKENNTLLNKRKSFSFITFPNGSISGDSISTEIISLVNGKTYLKQRDSKQLGYLDEPESVTDFYFRGWENSESRELTPGYWYEVSEDGRNIERYDGIEFGMGEFVTKRIATIMVARELILKERSLNLLINISPYRLSLKGYRYWSDFSDGKESEMSKRFNFLKEYTRRVETSGLLARSRFNESQIKSGEKSDTTSYSRDFFNTALVNFQRKRESVHNDKAAVPLNSTTKKLWKKMHDIK